MVGCVVDVGSGCLVLRRLLIFKRIERNRESKKLIRIRNLILFILYALWYGTPFRLWGIARKEIEVEHLAQVRKTVWELKKEGRVREDNEGRLWANRDEDK